MKRPTTDQRLTTPGFSREHPNGEQRQTLAFRLGTVSGYALIVGLLALLHGRNLDAGFTTETTLLVLLAAAVAAWWCPVLPVVVFVLISGVAWYWIDSSRMPESSNGVLSNAFRTSVILLLVFFIAHVKRQLLSARRLARIDGLTGLPNRQAILEALDAELCRVRRFGRPASIAMLDCDHFKQINDVHGHLAGDRVLRHVAEALRKSIRAYDCVGRLSGDEFVMIISEVNTNEVPIVVERIRAGLRHELNRETTSPTFSIGVVTIQFHGERDDPTIDSLECLRRADEAMYAAKAAGRDQTRFATIDWPLRGP